MNSDFIRFSIAFLGIWYYDNSKELEVIYMKQKNRNELTFFSKLLGRNMDKDALLSPVNLEEEHRTLLKYYVAFIESYPGIVLLFSLDGEIVTYNKDSIQRYLGYKNVRQFDFQQIVATEDYSLFNTSFEKAKHGETSQVEFQIHTKDREWRSVFTTLIPIYMTVNKVEFIMVILDDITDYRQLELSYRMKADHLEQAQQIADIGSWEYEIATDRINYSATFAQVFGCNPHKTLTKASLFTFIHPDDFKQFNHLFDKATSSGEDFFIEHRINHGITGEIRYVKVQAQVMLRNNEPFKLIGIVQDITREKLLQKQLIETDARYKYIFDHLQAGIWLKDSVNEEIIVSSKGLYTLFGAEDGELGGALESWKKFIHPDDWDRIKANNVRLLQGELIEQRYRIIDGAGVEKWIYEQTIPRFDEDGRVTHYFGMLIDITEKVRMETKLVFSAKHDALTSLPNQYSFHKHLDNLLATELQGEFSLLYIDIDNFHHINHRMGYEIGDDLIKHSAKRLTKEAPVHHYLARISTHTFAMILPDNVDKDYISRIAKHISNQMREKFIIQDYDIYVTVSMGISFYPDDALKKEELLTNAQSALIHAHRLGKNNYQFYSHEQDIDSFKKYVLEKDLRTAIDEEQFELYYQPQINIETDAVIAAEALIRWNHQEWGVISSEEFISLIEEKHLVHEVSKFTIESVCQQLHEWREQGYRLVPISVNISPLCFMKPGLAAMVAASLKRYNIPAKYLELEITESTLLRHEPYVTEKLNELQELGVAIAIDDFGTGSTSFHLLQHYDIDKLKIDKRFIHQLSFDYEDGIKEKAIVSSLLFLGNELQIDVVAEGVEEYEQLQFLKQKDCYIVQGHIYSRPVPPILFERILRTRYLKPIIHKPTVKPRKERRRYFRFVFPGHIRAKMFVTEVNHEKVSVSPAEILIENISVGGIRFLTTLRLPISTKVKLKFDFTILNVSFSIEGRLVYRNEEKADIYAYGVSFEINEGERSRLGKVINQLTVLERVEGGLSKMELINESPYTYLR